MSSDLFFVERPFMLTGEPAPRPPREPVRFGQPSYDPPVNTVRSALISEKRYPSLAMMGCATPTSNYPDYDKELATYWESPRLARAYRLRFRTLVHPDTAFVYARGRLMRESVIFDQPPYQDAKKRLSTWLQSLSWKTKRIKRGILLNTSRENNYYHLLHDFMTKIPYADDIGLAKDIPVIVSEAWVNSMLGKQFLQSDLFKSRTIVIQPENTFLRCNDLYVLQPTQNCQKLLGRVAASFDMQRPNSVMSSKFVLRRGDDVTHRRLCAGYDTLIKGLIQRGYQAIDPAQLTVPEQKWLFANATHIVGENGAAFANMIFCDTPKARIDALVTSKYATPTFQLLSSALDVKFQSHVIPSVISGNEVHATIPPETIDLLLTQNT